MSSTSTSAAPAAEIETPTWTFDVSYYEKTNKNDAFEIRTDPIKGKGLFALKAFNEGDIVLVERALVAGQNLDERFTPVCEHCLLSLESPLDIVSRVTKGKLSAAFNAATKGLVVPKPTIVYCEACGETPYCSEACRSEGYPLHHAALCQAKMTKEGVAALEDFKTNNWQQGGIDYTDSNWMALRLVARCLSQYRTKDAKTLAAAFQPLAQLIRAPIDRFHFSFLLKPDEMTEEEAWQQFLKFRNKPEYAPQVVEAESDDANITKKEMLAKGYQWMLAALNLTEEETAIVTPTVWSELIGAVLLNGQERTPNSPYTLFMRSVRTGDAPDTDDDDDADATDEVGKASSSSSGKKKKLKKGGAANPDFLKDFHLLVKEKGFDPKEFRQSTKGQAIYPIGCLFNHSCSPNLEVVYDETTNNETLIALCKTPIAAGDELCISYIDEDMDFRARQQQLEEHYLFRCGCAKCATEASLWPTL